MLLSLVDRLAPIFLLIAVGYLLVRRGILTPGGLDGLTKLAFWVLIPGTMFLTVSSIHVGEVLNLEVWGVYFGSIAVTAVVIYAVLMLRPETGRAERIVLAFGAVYSNLAIVGIPVIAILFGDRGLVVLTALITIHAAALITPTVMLMEGTKRADGPRRSLLGALGNQLANPILLSIVVGLVVSGTGLPVPGWLQAFTGMLKAAMPAIALIIIGAGLHGQEIRGNVATSAVGVAGKMILLPLVVFGVGSALGMTREVLAPLVVAAGLPPGINAVMMAAAYRTAIDRTSTMMLASTILSLVTIPLLALFLTA
ncbi:AEC family transporter [Aurantimonas coralicida]|uniref:AEC family transporter n=1 Tax=Aurantimonas coralicida TaxID=182270 RepID=UPI001E623E15|nr:AEC family transporter [Aurantimonas coralicida]MCD1642665.1 AEC family transporter [Aurantimonas coralicida]